MSPKPLVIRALNLLLFLADLKIILFIIGLSSGNLVLANTETQQQPGPYIPRPADTSTRPQLMVAIYCGQNANSNSKSTSLFHNQYLELDSRKWRTDRDPAAVCTQDKQEVLNYCRKVYPNHDIRNIVESSRPYKLENWCKIGSQKKRCHTRLTVKPYRCLEGTFQSDALLVPERCLFDHVHNKSICENSDHWNRTASDNCLNKDMKLQSFAMLQPCGLGIFSGVEFVCCPANNQQQQQHHTTSKPVSEGNSFAQAANGALGWPKNSKYELEEKFNHIKVDEETNNGKQKHHEQSDNEDRDDDPDSDGEDEEEYDDDEDEYDDDSSSWNNDKSSSSSTTTSTTTTTTTTTTTERPMDHYLSHFDLAHEHDEFRRAEMAVEANYRDKINHVMKEWGQLDGHFEEMKKKNPQAAEEFKKKMTYQFQKTIAALEEEGAAQRHQLASMHAERAMAIINRRKKAAMDCLTQALDRIPIRTRPVERCIIKLLKALEKDRTHTLRQYKNLLNLNTREALREKKIILDHLVTLNRAANQSIAMLDRSPVLVDKLKSRIVALWHRLRNIPADEPIVRDSELRILEKYEEEVAQHKIELERQRLLEQEVVQDSTQESLSKSIKEESNINSTTTINNNNNDSFKQVDDSTTNNVKSVSSSPSTDAGELASPQQAATNKPPPVEPSSRPQIIIQMNGQQLQQNPGSNDGNHGDDIDNEISSQLETAKFAHLKVDTTHQDYSFKHEPIESQMKFGYSTFLVSACTVVVVLALISMRYYSKHSTRAYRRQGFAEVGRSCPEEKSVTSMQFNGYENPAYKFFEAEA